MTIPEFLSDLQKRGIHLGIDGTDLSWQSAQGHPDEETLHKIKARKPELVRHLNSHNYTVETLPATDAQRALWNIWKKDSRLTAYHAAISMRIPELEPGRLVNSFKRVSDRHAALRTVYTRHSGNVFQHVKSQLPPEHHQIDTRMYNESERRAELVREYERPFDLENSSPLRLSLLRYSQTGYLLLVTVHHIALDGWSAWLLLEEVISDYMGNSGTAGNDGLDFPDYVREQKKVLASSRGRDLAAYWEQQLKGAPLTLNLPEDLPRPKEHRFQGSTLEVTPGVNLSAKIRATARNLDVTLFTLLLAAYQILIGRYTGQDDLLIGSPAAGRTRPEHDRTIGYLVNMIVIRGNLEKNIPFASFAEKMADTVREAYAHQDYPFQLLVSELMTAPDNSRHPVFQAEFGLQESPGNDSILRLYVPQETDKPLSVAGLKVEHCHTWQQEGQFDIGLDMVDLDDQICGMIRYNSDLFKRRAMAEFIQRYLTLLESICNNPEELIHDLAITSEEEKADLRKRSAPGMEPELPFRNLVEWFDHTATSCPDSVAVDDGSRALTYRELQKQSFAVAHAIRNSRSFRSGGRLTGICLDRTVGLAVSILGILRSGSAYLPLDPSNPADRLSLIVEDSGLETIITQNSYAGLFENRELIFTDENLDLDGQENEQPFAVPDIDPEETAYVIYTSGSTGHPKGTLVSHRNVLRLFTSTDEWFKFDHTDVWTMFHSYAFDFSVWEMWGALLKGGTLQIVPLSVIRSPERFCDYLNEKKVTVLNQTPSAFYSLLNEVKNRTNFSIPSLQWVIFGGEALQTAALKPWFERFGDRQPTLVNMYGITETTVHVTWRKLTLNDCDNHVSPIGQPIPDLGLSIRDRRGNLVPDGLPGELYVSGAGVSKGYLHREALTAERFLTDSSGMRLYRTGDLVRRTTGGELIYIGRTDQQVKVRGYRIEPGEIEFQINRHPGISSVVVTIHDSLSGKQLVAYCVRETDREIGEYDLKQYLKEHLPGYMIPATILFIDKIPLTSNGKVDRHALPSPARSAEIVPTADPHPKELRHSIAQICAEVLQRNDLPFETNFFDLGADSLRINQIYQKLKPITGDRIRVVDLYEYPTINRLAEHLEKNGNMALPEPETNGSRQRQSGRNRRAMMRKRRGGAE